MRMIPSSLARFLRTLALVYVGSLVSIYISSDRPPTLWRFCRTMLVVTLIVSPLIWTEAREGPISLKLNQDIQQSNVDEKHLGNGSSYTHSKN